MPTPNQTLVDNLKVRLGEPRRSPVEDLSFGVTDGSPSQTFNLPVNEGIDSTALKVWVGDELWSVVVDISASGASDKHVQVDFTTGLVTFGDDSNGKIPPVRSPLYTEFFNLKQTFTDAQFDNIIIEAFKQLFMSTTLGTTFNSTTKVLTLPSGNDEIHEEALILTWAEFMTAKAAFHYDEFYLFRQQGTTIDTTKTGRISLDYLEGILAKAKKKALRRYVQRRQGVHVILTSASDLIVDLIRPSLFVPLSDQEFNDFSNRRQR